jgi:hypothetical protein
MMDTQLIEHLKVQLVNKNRPREVGGAVLWTGYGGAMDSAALNVLQAEVDAKEQERERKAQEKEQKKEEREQKRLETARAKEARAAAKATKAAENAEQIGERGSGRGRGRSRGVGKGRGRGGSEGGGRGRGRGRGRGQARAARPSPHPFLMDEESEESEEELTEDDPGTHETNSVVSTGSRTDAKDSDSESIPNTASLDPATSNPPSPAANIVSSDHFEGPEDPGGCLRLQRRAGLPKRYCS